MNLDEIKTSFLEQLPSYSDHIEKTWDYFRQDLEETKLFLESLLESEAANQTFKESVRTLSKDIVFLSSSGQEAIDNREFESAANNFEELSQKILAFKEKYQNWLYKERIQELKVIADKFKFSSRWSRGWYFVTSKLGSKDEIDFLELIKNCLIGFEIIADTIDKYFDSFELATKNKFASEILEFFTYFANLISTFISLEDIVTKKTKNDQILIKLKQTRNTLGFIAWKLSSSTQDTESTEESEKELEKSEEELEYSKFRARLSEYPDWDREEQIKKNQGAINLIRSWLAEEISEEERKAREEHFEIFKQIVDAQKPPGHKLYSEE